jgi:PPE-repeat protein
MMFAAIPPEITSAQIYAGAGAGPLLSSAASWNQIAAELTTAATATTGMVTELQASWMGPSATAMTRSALGYVDWMRLTAGQAERTAMAANSAAAAYESAFAGIVPPPVIAVNRARLVSLIATNVLGVNTAAIMATEAEYAEFWAQDATVMYEYQSASAAATSQLTPFRPPSSVATGLNPAAVTATAGNAQSTLSGLLQQFYQEFITGSVTPTGNGWDAVLWQSLGQQTIPALLEDSVQNFSSSGPWQAPAQMLALLALYPAFAGLTQGQQQQPASTPTYPVGGSDVTPYGVSPDYAPGGAGVYANAGSAQSIGNNLSVPSAWGTPPGSMETGPSVGTPMITENVPPTAPVGMVPPIVGSPGGQLQRPRYGKVLKVISRNPAGG